MANPLARTIMGNMARKSGKVKGNTNPCSSVKNINQDEEDLLVNIINKGSNYKSCNSNNVSNVGTSFRSNHKRSIKLEDLAKNDRGAEVKSPSNPAGQKGAVTLDELASKNKKSESTESESAEKTKPSHNVNNKNVKKVVINNLEAGIPKVSLDSMGTKGSLK